MFYHTYHLVHNVPDILTKLLIMNKSFPNMHPPNSTNANLPHDVVQV
jgi:hypothetical protein